MFAEDKIQLMQNIIAGLPGSEESFTLDDLKAALARYKDIDTKTLQQHLIDFLKEIIPVAEEAV
jgi:mannonate dehydratase